jgi:archaeal flagellar protein FlaI
MSFVFLLVLSPIVILFQTSILSRIRVVKKTDPPPVTSEPQAQFTSEPCDTISGEGTVKNLWGQYWNLYTTLCRDTAQARVLFFLAAGIAAGTGLVVFLIELPDVVFVIFLLTFLLSVVPVIQATRVRFQAYTAGISNPAITVLSPEIPVQPLSGPDPEPDLPALPVHPDREHGLLDHYWITPRRSHVRIIRKGNAGFSYVIGEPEITEQEKMVLRETYAFLRDEILYDEPGTDKVDPLTREKVVPIIHDFDPTISSERLDVMYYYLRRDLSGYGPLDPIMHDPAIEDISCNGQDLPVFVFHRAYGNLPTNVTFGHGDLNQFVLKLAQKANKQLSLSNPMVDATLPDGARIQITYSDIVSTKGSSFTIRKFRAEPMTPLDLIRFKTFNPELLAFLWLVIEHRKSILIAGGTASGKTSTMNAVSVFIPLNAKIVSLEDTREIQLPHENWLPTQTREVNAPGVKGDIDLFALLKACMRQRPEYIIVGEVRGREAQTLFQAMNTGHATLSTIHAGSVQEAINRLTHEPINVPSIMFSALDIAVIQGIYSFGSTRIRRCLSINEIHVDNNGRISSIPLYTWNIHEDRFEKISIHSKVLEEIAFTRGWSEEQTRDELKKREEFLTISVEVPVPNIIDLAHAIHGIGD